MKYKASSQNVQHKKHRNERRTERSQLAEAWREKFDTDRQYDKQREINEWTEELSDRRKSSDNAHQYYLAVAFFVDWV